MKIEMGQIPERIARDEVLVGNVYPAKGGKGTRFWLVIAVQGNSVHMLGLNLEGQIVSSTSYGAHALEDRPIVGYCPGVIDFAPHIGWLE